MPTQELVLVFFRSRDKLHWDPVERDDIPEWLRSEEYINRLIAGEAVRNILEDAENKQMWWWTATAIDPKRVLEATMEKPTKRIQLL